MRSFWILLGISLVLLVGGCVQNTNHAPLPPSSCVENWKCSAWGACVNGHQLRSCTDYASCGTFGDKPATSRSCESLPPVTPACGDRVCQSENGETCSSCATDCGSCPTPSPDLDVSTKIGPIETVFDYQSESCASLDLPDVQTRAFRDAQNHIVLVSGNAPDNYWMFGNDFNHLSRSCAPVYRSGDKPNVTDFSPQQWINSTYTEDGVHVYGLVHDEYHDPFAANCKPGDTSPANLCWYNFISLVKSSNGGKAFTQPTPPSNVVAILPFKWSPTVSGARSATAKPNPHGYMSPTNIVKGKDGYYYAALQAFTAPTGTPASGVCMMRTKNLEDASTWKLWDGDSYAIPLTNPYVTSVANPIPYECAFVSHDTIGGMSGSLTYNTYLQRYMMVGADVFPDDSGKLVCGFYFSLSNDLITWGKPHFIRKSQFGFEPCASGYTALEAQDVKTEAYPSLIDHDSPDRSFTTANESAYIYFMQNKDNHSPGGWGFRRNLVRIPITFTLHEGS